MRLAERLREALDQAPALGRIVEEHAALDGLTPAAVLVAITDRPDPGVMLTVRNAGLRRHAGQIAFPGGRADPEDHDRIATALREAEEEIGMPPSSVEVIGAVDPYWTGSGYDITPVIGVVPADLVYVPHEAEVADIFEVPLAFLLAKGNHARHSMEWQGSMRSYYEINWGDRRIWGVTAGVIVALAARLETFA